MVGAPPSCLNGTQIAFALSRVLELGRLFEAFTVDHRADFKSIN
jgi:hypothetical protein